MRVGKLALFVDRSDASAAVREANVLVNEMRLLADMRLELQLYSAVGLPLAGLMLAICEIPRSGHRSIEAAACDLEASVCLRRLRGELIERLDLAEFQPGQEDWWDVSEEDLRRQNVPVISVRDLVGQPIFSSRWPWSIYSAQESTTWLTATAYTDGREAAVPLNVVWTQDRSSLWFELTTVGVAAGTSQRMARSNAWNELVERDVLKAAWVGRQHSSQEIPDAVSEVRRSYTGKTAQSGEWIERYYLISDDAAAGSDDAVTLCYRRHRELPLVSLGSSFGRGAMGDCWHAYSEAIHGSIFSWLNREEATQLADFEVVDFLGHARYYNTYERISSLEDFLRGGTSRSKSIRTASERPRKEDTWVVNLAPSTRKGIYTCRLVNSSAQTLEADHGSARVVGPPTKWRENVVIDDYKPAPFA